MSAIRRQRVDALEVERFRALVTSPAFSVLRSRLEHSLERSRRDLEAKEEMPNVYRAQGRVSAIREMLALPDAMLAEMEKKQ